MKIAAFSPKMVLVGVITLYQKTLSPDHGLLKGLHPHGFCRFYPSCSQYAKESVQTYGVFCGSWLASKRLLRCHPWATPGFDPVPPAEVHK